MIRTVLFLLISSVVVYGQDTLDVVESKAEITHAEITALGDTSLVRLVYDQPSLALRGSVANFYSRNQKLANVDLKILGSKKLACVTRHGDTIDYYTFDAKIKKSVIYVSRSIFFNAASHLRESTVDGTALGMIDRKGIVSVVTFNLQEKKVKVFDEKDDKFVLAQELPVPWNLEGLTTDQVTLITSNVYDPVDLSPSPFKVFLDNNTLAVVFDDSYRDLADPNGARKTLVLRKDLAAGTVQADGFRIVDEGSIRSRFSSYLDGNLLYRIFYSKGVWQVAVQDLDSNETIYKMDLPKIDEKDLYEYDHSETAISKVDHEVFVKHRDDPVGVRIVAGNAKDGQKLMSVGFITSIKHGVRAVPLLTGGVGVSGDYYFYTVYYNLRGSSKTGFSVDQYPALFDRMAAAYDNLRKQKLNLDYAQIVASKNSVIYVSSIKRSLRYVILKFSAGAD